LTTAVIGTGAGAGVDSAREQEKLEAKRMLENVAEPPASSAPTHEGKPSFFPQERCTFLELCHDGGHHFAQEKQGPKSCIMKLA